MVDGGPSPTGLDRVEREKKSATVICEEKSKNVTMAIYLVAPQKEKLDREHEKRIARKENTEKRSSHAKTKTWSRRGADAQRHDRPSVLKHLNVMNVNLIVTFAQLFRQRSTVNEKRTKMPRPESVRTKTTTRRRRAKKNTAIMNERMV